VLVVISASSCHRSLFVLVKVFIHLNSSGLFGREKSKIYWKGFLRNIQSICQKTNKIIYKLTSEHALKCVLRGSSIFWMRVNLEYLL